MKFLLLLARTKFQTCFNPLAPKSDQHIIAYVIISESHILGYSNHQLKKLLIIKQILLKSTLGNVSKTKEDSIENMQINVGV